MPRFGAANLNAPAARHLPDGSIHPDDAAFPGDEVREGGPDRCEVDPRPQLDRDLDLLAHSATVGQSAATGKPGSLAAGSAPAARPGR